MADYLDKLREALASHVQFHDSNRITFDTVEWGLACDPNTIRTLLAERDALREALESIVECCEEDHAARDYCSRQTEIRGIARAGLTPKETP